MVVFSIKDVLRTLVNVLSQDRDLMLKYLPLLIKREKFDYNLIIILNAFFIIPILMFC